MDPSLTERLVSRASLTRVYVDNVTRVYIGVVVLLLVYLPTLYVTRPRRFVVFVTIGMQGVLCALFATLYRLNGSQSAFNVVLKRPKTWGIFALLLTYTLAVSIQPIRGVQSGIDAIGFIILYVGAVFLDGMIDRPRVVVFTFLLCMLTVTAWMTYDWAFSDLALGKVLFVIWGTVVTKRAMARSTLVSLVLQLVEGFIFMFRSVVFPSKASLNKHFIFVRRLARFTDFFPNGVQPQTTVVMRVKRVFRFLKLILVACTVALFAALRKSKEPIGHTLLIATTVLTVFIPLGFFALAWRNFSWKIAREMVKQPNIWILGILALLNLTATMVYPRHPVLSPIRVVILIASVVGFISTDALLVTDLGSMATLGVCFMLGLLMIFVEFIFFLDVDFDSYVLLSWRYARLTHYDVTMALLQNYILLTAEAVLALIHNWRTGRRRCAFVRQLVEREVILETNVFTDDAAEQVRL